MKVCKYSFWSNRMQKMIECGEDAVFFVNTPLCYFHGKHHMIDHGIPKEEYDKYRIREEI